jgi:hypothetical protein
LSDRSPSNLNEAMIGMERIISNLRVLEGKELIPHTHEHLPGHVSVNGKESLPHVLNSDLGRRFGDASGGRVDGDYPILLHLEG